jgi:hypothetical protein
MFRNTRHLLGAAIELGVSPRVIANELGVRIDTVRTRAGNHGAISQTDFATLAGLSSAHVQSWALPPARGAEDEEANTATDLLRALVLGAVTLHPRPSA